MRLRASIALLTAASVASFATTWYVLQDSPTAQAAAASNDDAVVSAFGSSASYTWGGATTEEWATNADHVVDVSMTAEKAGRADSALVDRIGTFTVNEVLTSRVGAPALPNEFSMRVAGWSIDQASGERQPLVLEEGLPRLEVGHRYVLALAKLEPRCNPEDGVYPGGWSILTPEAALPYDDAVLGEGEVQSSTTEPLDGSSGSVADEVVDGEVADTEDLVDELEAAPEEKRDPQPGDRIGC